MRKDIEIPKMEDVGIAIIPQENEGQKFWQAYVVNFGSSTLETVLISSKGFGTLKGKEKETATMRHLIEVLEPKTGKAFEGLIEDLTALTNEFWLSFYKGSKLYDKKFVFLAESISEDNLVEIPILDSKGVLIK